MFAHRRVTLKGRWTFAVTGDVWRLTLRDAPRAVTSLAPPGRIEATIAWLEGQRLISVTVQPSTGHTHLAFDLGAELTVPKSAYLDGTMWTLYQPRGRALSVRVGGSYQAGLASADPRWRTLPAPAA